MTARDVILEKVVPILGGIIGVLMFASPGMAVLRARKERVLGDLNPLPFPAIFANCAAWVAYSYVVKDVLILWPNEVGLLLGLFYTLSCYGLADTKTRDRQMAIMLFFAVVLSVIGSVGTLGEFEGGKLKNLWGFTANGVLLIYYAAPLSTIVEVIRSRSSSSLYLPLCLMNVVNGLLWLAYGLAIKDHFVAVPNGIGAGMGLVLIALILIFPKKSNAKRSPTESEASDVTPSGSRKELVPGQADLEQQRGRRSSSDGGGRP